MKIGCKTLKATKSYCLKILTMEQTFVKMKIEMLVQQVYLSLYWRGDGTRKIVDENELFENDYIKIC
ncbi:uncharacterized protein MONOS_14889 [Monocercomonoides exilis]|uniref:uncharacterized protein n=1 Tax=Monocercomonoides exilis TaxID=2049356 RepID=UPI00355959CE|nr:hypothetical protein MONOS_14889 [Monocercomonoides exilis]